MKYDDKVYEAISLMMGLRESHDDYSWNDSSNSVWATVGEDIYPHGHTACYATMQSNHREDCDYVINHILPRKFGVEGDEDGIAFLHYLFNHSPFASVFITKDAEQAMTERWFVCDANAPANLLVGGLTLSRTLTEYTQIVVVFNDLVKAGVTPNLAIVLAHCASCGSTREGNIEWANVHGTHKSFNSYEFSRSTVSNVVNNNPQYLREPYTKCTNYNGVHRIFGGGDNWLVEFIKKNYDAKKLLTTVKKSSAVELNPFRRKVAPTTSRNNTDYKTGIKAMAIFSKQIEKELP